MKTSVLMFNGPFDYFYPEPTAQEPLYELLGAPADNKHRMVYDASHNIPRNEMMKEVVNWMEK